VWSILQSESHLALTFLLLAKAMRKESIVVSICKMDIETSYQRIQLRQQNFVQLFFFVQFIPYMHEPIRDFHFGFRYDSSSSSQLYSKYITEK
jgi:hypothetical protein